MEGMFRKKIAVRVSPPASSDDSPFFQVQIRINPSSAPSLPDSPLSGLHHIADESLSVGMESLCWNLSRAYQNSQSESVDRVVREIRRRFPNILVGVKEEVTSGSAIAQALECNLRCAFLDNHWTCVGYSLLVESGLSLEDERKQISAISVNVHFDVDDGFTLLASPDIVRFSRFKISDLLDSQTETKFYDGDEVTLCDRNSAKYCHFLPSLSEGYVTGVQKGRSLTEDMKKALELLSCKHGLAMVNDHFARIQFERGGNVFEKWFPSSVVLQGSGLFPAPKTARVMKTASALCSFVKIIEGWNFFDQGIPMVKVLSSFDIESESFTWTKAANAVTNCISRESTHPFWKKTGSSDLSALTHLFSSNDFRTPKPSHCIPLCTKVLQEDGYYEIAPTISINTQNLQLSSSLDKEGHDDFRAQEKNCRKEAAPGVSGNMIKPKFQPRNFSKFNISSGSTTFRGKNADHTSITSNRSQKMTNTRPEAIQTEETSDLAHAEISNKISEQRGKITGSKIKSAPQKVKRPAEETIENGQSATVIREAPCAVPAKRKMEKKEDGCKKKQNAPSDQAILSSKVIECHSKDSLGSLTVAELKSFLSLKKAKVGGKKEELVQRVASLLA